MPNKQKNAPTYTLNPRTCTTVDFRSAGQTRLYRNSVQNKQKNTPVYTLKPRTCTAVGFRSAATSDAPWQSALLESSVRPTARPPASCKGCTSFN